MIFLNKEIGSFHWSMSRGKYSNLSEPRPFRQFPSWWFRKICEHQLRLVVVYPMIYEVLDTSPWWFWNAGFLNQPSFHCLHARWSSKNSGCSLLAFLELVGFVFYSIETYRNYIREVIFFLDIWKLMVSRCWKKTSLVGFHLWNPEKNDLVLVIREIIFETKASKTFISRGHPNHEAKLSV